jgi:hypothetical protein
MSYSTSPRKVPVGTTAVLISGSATLRGRIIRNLGTASVFLGGADVTASGATMGFEVAAGADFPDIIGNGAIYGIRDALTEDVQVWEVIQ